MYARIHIFIHAFLHEHAHVPDLTVETAVRTLQAAAVGVAVFADPIIAQYTLKLFMQCDHGLFFLLFASLE